ncbi:unnamed protein product [Psylliodes chrysocephalus]|uniref:Uncharacterized protein n=1 Tax=Psylliodes chrysocephalus TaxID=3402493 RepID=A0A9P0G7V4_9CUCU|nr:unnamed protein product [Psylliodes chrysocephala]
MKEVPLNDAYRLRKLKNTYKSLKYIKPINELISPIDYSKLGLSEKNPSLLASTDSTEMFTIKGPPQRRSSKNVIKENGHTAKEEDEEKEIQMKSYRGSLEHADQSSQKKNDSEIIIDVKKNPLSKERSGNLPLEIRDSMILRQTSLIKQRCRSFSLTPKDSIDVKNESELSAVLRKHSSKLISTRDSVAYLKESKLALLSAGVCNICHHRNALRHYDKDYCCEKCLKEISEDKMSLRQGKNENEKSDPSGMDQPKQLKLSHVEVIEMDQVSTKNVIVVPEPTVIDSDNSLIMGTGKHFKPARKPKENKSKVKVDPCQNLYKPSAEIEGDKTNKEYLQNNNEFTKDRVRSFIKIMDSHPNLIKLFTSCQQ